MTTGTWPRSNGVGLQGEGGGGGRCESSDVSKLVHTKVLNVFVYTCVAYIDSV